jgi:hypothetical protein
VYTGSAGGATVMETTTPAKDDAGTAIKSVASRNFRIEFNLIFSPFRPDFPTPAHQKLKRIASNFQTRNVPLLLL